MANVLTGGLAIAQTMGGEDTRLRLSQGLDQQSAEIERQLLKDTDDLGTPSTIKIDDKTYSVDRRAKRTPLAG